MVSKKRKNKLRALPPGPAKEWYDYRPDISRWDDGGTSDRRLIDIQPPKRREIWPWLALIASIIFITLVTALS